jgi:hypothetical protein
MANIWGNFRRVIIVADTHHIASETKTYLEQRYVPGPQIEIWSATTKAAQIILNKWIIQLDKNKDDVMLIIVRGNDETTEFATRSYEAGFEILLMGGWKTDFRYPANGLAMLRNERARYTPDKQIIWQGLRLELDGMQGHEVTHAWFDEIDSFGDEP